jgi:hypothetical protein
MTAEPGIAAVSFQATSPVVVNHGASTSLFARVNPEYEAAIIAINGEFPFLNGHS